MSGRRCEVCGCELFSSNRSRCTICEELKSKADRAERAFKQAEDDSLAIDWLAYMLGKDFAIAKRIMLLMWAGQRPADIRATIERELRI